MKRRNGRQTNRNYVMLRLEEAGGEWVAWSNLVRDGWDRNAVFGLHEEGVIERRVDTLTEDRSPGWIGRVLAEHGYSNPWSVEANDFADAYRIPKGTSTDVVDNSLARES